MQAERMGLQTLADRARGGDAGAMTALWQELNSSVSRFVRNVLRGGRAPAALIPRIRSELKLFNSQGAILPPGEEALLVDRISGRICSSVVAELQSAGPAGTNCKETVLV